MSTADDLQAAPPCSSAACSPSPSSASPSSPAAESDWIGPGTIPTVAEVEKRHILAVLEHFGGNRTRAARALGIGANTLWRKLKQWGVPPAREGDEGVIPAE